MLCFKCFVLELSDDLNLDVYFPQFAQFLLSGDEAPAFAKLCAVGTWVLDAEHALEASLCKRFGVEKQADWPLAPIALIGEEAQQEAGYWFVVHPAHFVLQRDFFTLGDAVRLTTEEIALLATALNQHFYQDGLKFMPSKAGDFLFLHVSHEVDVSTYLLSEAMGRDVGKHMPSGKDGMKFQALLNEVQMLLHDHPLNQAREQKGQLAVNSLWLSGGGSFHKLNLSNHKSAVQFFANDALITGLAKWANIACQPLVLDFTSIENRDVVLVLDKAKGLDASWFVPLLNALKAGSIKTLRCHFDVHGMTFTLHLKARDTWKFWRKLKPISTYFNLVSS